MVKRRGLGRGLDALLGETVPSAVMGRAEDGALRSLPLDLIQRGRYQPRTHMDPVALEELADSIRAQGVVQPIVVRPVGEGMPYEIIAGERRWRAAQAAGLDEIPAVIRHVPDDAAVAMALIENIQRENLNPMEEARALRRLIEEFEMTHEIAARAVGRSRAAVSNLLRLLDLNPEVKELVESDALEMGHARALLALEGDVQSATARRVASGGLSVRETERLVKRLKTKAEQSDTPGKGGRDPNIVRLEQELAERLGSPVSIDHGPSGRGQVIIRYSSLDELDGVLERLRRT